jgi:TP901 family phage tail tape measure protein
MPTSGNSIATAYVDILVSTAFAKSMTAARSAFKQEMSRLAGDGNKAVGTKLFDGLKSRVSAVTAEIGRMGTSLRAIATPWAAMAGVGGGAFALGASVKQFGDFEQSMARVKAITGASVPQFEALSAQARKLGKETVFSSQDAANAMGYFAQNGLKVDEIMKAMPGTLNLAAAGQLDMATSADIVSKIMKGMKIPAEEVGRVVDVMAQAFTTSNTDLQMLGEAFKYVGPVAASSNSSLEETTAMIQILSDAGIQASMAGTSLRQLFVNLRSPTKEAKKALDGLGVSVYDSAGKFMPMSSIIDQLNRATAGMTEEQRNAALGHIAETRALSGLIELMSAGGDVIRTKMAALFGSAGRAAMIAAIQMNTLWGKFEQLKGSVSEVANNIGEALKPALVEISAWFERLADRISVKKDLMPWLVGMAPKILGIVAALKVLKVTFTLLGAAMGTSGLALLFSPAGVLVLGVTALAAAFVHAQMTGQTWFDSIAEGTARLLGFENAVTRANDAIAAGNVTKKNTRDVLAILAKNEQQRLRGESTQETVSANIAELEKEIVAQKAHARKLAADEQSESAALAIQTVRRYQQKVEELKAQLESIIAMDAYRAKFSTPAAAAGGDISAAQSAVAGAAAGGLSWLKGLGAGFVEMGGNVVDGMIQEYQKGKKARDQGGELSDVTSFLTSMQQKLMEKNQEKLQADIEKNTADTAVATTKVMPDLLTGIKTAIGNLKFGFAP